MTNSDAEQATKKVATVHTAAATIIKKKTAAANRNGIWHILWDNNIQYASLHIYQQQKNNRK